MTANIPLRDGLRIELTEKYIWLHIPVSAHGVMAFQIHGSAVDGQELRNTLEAWVATPVNARSSELIEPGSTVPANDRQVGGDHYKKRGIQPWDYIAANCLDWFTGEIIKYITRWRDKGGIKDLEKARHVLDKYIETEKAKGAAEPTSAHPKPLKIQPPSTST
jgi:hypothetical protein